MAELRDGLLRALLARFEAGEGLAIALVVTQCCYGAAERGPTECTCWTPEFDVEQSTPDIEAVVGFALGEMDPPRRERMCGDCAYRPESPEKTGAESVDGDAAMLERLAADGTRFWCHDGMRTPVAWRHPAGIRIPAVGVGDYQPPIVDGVPYRADGQPGLLCAGWLARNRALNPQVRACRSREDSAAVGAPTQGGTS